MKKITVSVACDGFSVEFDGQRYRINQEDDPGEVLKEIFETLGFEVELEEDW